jgi:enediyne biosynthesis protein E4
VRYGDKRQAQEVLSQSSYLSVNDSRLHFGLGQVRQVDVEIRWPLGQIERLTEVPADQLIYVTEGSGITRTQTFK